MQRIVIALLILMIPIANAATLHVDDDKKDYPNAEYDDIQQAINAAKDGDVILVYRGAYKPFVVDKKLNITGVNFPEVVASKRNSKIEVLADGIVLKGILTNATIMLNSSNNLIIENGIVGKTGIVVNGYNNTIADNALLGNKYGVLLRSNNNTLFANSFRGCNFSVSGRGVSYTLITRNEFIGNNVSIVFFKSKNNVISKNAIFNSRILGVHLFESSKTLVSENKFANCTGWALRIYDGSENVIGGNVFENNTVTEIKDVPAGFNVFVMNSSSNTIAGNVIKGVIQNIAGVFAFNASDLRILKNIVSSNVFGVYLWKCNDVKFEKNYIALNGNGTKIDESSRITIYNSTFRNNDWATVVRLSEVNITKNLYVLNLYTLNLKSSDKAKIVQNAIVRNKYGIRLESSNSCLVKDNLIAGVDDFAVNLLSSNKNLIYNNTMKDNKGGLNVEGSENEITRNVVSIKNGDYILHITKPRNEIYFNDFMNGKVYSTGGNLFNSPKKLKYNYNGKTFTNYLGNFWNDVTESMLKMLDPDNDGVLIKQKILGLERDKYPLAKSIKNYEIIS